MSRPGLPAPLAWVGATSRRPAASTAVFLCALALLVGLALTRADDPVLDPDLFSLVTTASGSDLRSQALTRIRTLSEQRQTWIVQHRDQDQAATTARALRGRLLATGLFDAPIGQTDPAAALELYDQAPFRLADEVSLALWRAGDTRALVTRVEQALYGNAVALPGFDMAADPFLLKARFLAELTEVPEPYHLDGGMLARADDAGWTYLINLALEGSAFDFDFQEALEAATAPLIRELGSQTDADIASVGAIDFAAANRRLALTEAGTIGAASLLLITLLLALSFRHPRPFLAVLTTIALAVTGGAAVCVLAWGSIHLLTLVGGASLIGISVDYAFHLLADSYRDDQDWSPAAALERVLPAVSLGLATSLLGFLGLYASGFAGLRQIAVFSGAGLTTAYLSLIFCYPLLLGRWRLIRRHTGPIRVARWWMTIWRPRRRTILALGLAAGMLAWFAPSIRTESDVRLLTAETPTIDALLTHTRQLSASLLDSRFFLVEAADHEQLLRNEEALRARLLPHHEAGDLSHFYQLSRFVPSRARQQEVLALNAALLAPGGAVEQLIERVGLNRQAVERLREALAEERPPLTLEAFLESPLAPLAGHLYLGQMAGRVASVVTLAGVTDVEALASAAAGLEGVSFVDNVADISGLFGLYVDNALRGLLIAFGLVALLMIARFGWREGALTMLVPLIAFTLTVSVFQLLGEPINLFHIVGLALVLGTGMDYTLFLKSGNTGPHTMLAVLLAALTTECAFGLLGLSQVRAIHAFGATVALGTVLTFLLAPMVSARAS